jgi:hypothetical protein
MDLQQFKDSLTQSAPPANLSNALQALWQAAKGDWKAAHVLAQAQDDAIGAWVHAYLHHEEGDATNAAHWYRRANRPVSQLSLEKEWDEIAQALLAHS